MMDLCYGDELEIHHCHACRNITAWPDELLAVAAAVFAA